jgi:hypothetical protein
MVLQETREPLGESRRRADQVLLVLSFKCVCAGFREIVHQLLRNLRSAGAERFDLQPPFSQITRACKFAIHIFRQYRGCLKAIYA